MSDTMKRPEKIVIVGMGAMGLLYAERLCSRKSCDVTFLMDEERFAKYSGADFLINGKVWHFKMTTPQRYPADEKADFVMVATKATALEEAMELMECCVGSDTVIVSVLNGITSERIIGERFGNANVVPCVAQGMDAVKFGNELNYSKEGCLFIGPGPDTDAKAYERLSELFDNYGVSWQASDNIMLRMWKKFMLNCGINQACMIYGGTYGTAVVPETDIYNTFVGSMQEVRRLAGYEGYIIGEEDVDYYIELMSTLNPDGMPSMAQDRINHKKSEVELFAGTVIRLADKYGIDVPINRRIYEEVKRIEEGL